VEQAFAYRACASNTLPMLRGIARFILKVCGWTPVGDLPTDDKVVFAAAPHTTNWDGFWLLVYKIALDVEVSASTVQQVVDIFAERDRFWFALAPEGTRKWQPYWKTGFYRIAKSANVPLVLAFIDYKKKQMGIGITLPDGQTMEQDLQTIREFYAPFTGGRPERQGPVEFPPE
jgi:1-acyl-sn-glycerol-3-phosphate acyltransferase